MAQWWELDKHELQLDEEALKYKRTAYWNTFYSTEEGQQVLLDIKSMCYESADLPAVAQLALIRLYHDIRACCGADVNSAKRAIEAEGSSIIIT